MSQILMHALNNKLYTYKYSHITCVAAAMLSSSSGEVSSAWLTREIMLVADSLSEKPK